MYTLLLIIFILVVILLIPTILLQSGSGAQSGMFGSDLAMGAFGAKTSEVLLNFTKWLVGIFMVLAFLLGYIKIQETKAYVRQVQPTQTDQNPNQQAAQPSGRQAGQPTNTAQGNTAAEMLIPTNITTNLQGK